MGNLFEKNSNSDVVNLDRPEVVSLSGFCIPGTVYYLSPSNFKETLHISHIHDISFLTALQFAKELKIPITAKIAIIAVEIIEDLTFGDCFTPELQEKYEEIIQEMESMVNELIQQYA